jgi:hypothetical protein
MLFLGARFSQGKCLHKREQPFGFTHRRFYPTGLLPNMTTQERDKLPQGRCFLALIGVQSSHPSAIIVTLPGKIGGYFSCQLIVFLS